MNGLNLDKSDKRERHDASTEMSDGWIREQKLMGKTQRAPFMRELICQAGTTKRKKKQVCRTTPGIPRHNTSCQQISVEQYFSILIHH